MGAKDLPTLEGGIQHDGEIEPAPGPHTPHLNLLELTL